jgi:tuberous sclerosis 2
VGIVQRVCTDVCIKFVNDRDTFLGCLFVIETVICYTVFPNEILAPCIIVLCRAVNSEVYLETSYKIMKNLLGTQLGYASLLTMTTMLNDSRYYVDAQVLRGAVFHINMNLWGGNNNSSLQNGMKYSSTVLSSYLKVLQSGYIIVTYEVILSMQTLLNKCGRELSEPSWDIVVEILESIVENIGKYRSELLRRLMRALISRARQDPGPFRSRQAIPCDRRQYRGFGSGEQNQR